MTQAIPPSTSAQVTRTVAARVDYSRSPQTSAQTEATNEQTATTTPTPPAAPEDRKLQLWEIELARLTQVYESDIRNTRYRALIYGGTGVGKTTSLRSCRLPLLVHSFDPGGSKAFADLVAKDQVLIDATFENEDPRHPTAFAKWDAAITSLERVNAFAHFGTYVVDSATTWAQCALYQVLKESKRAGGVPQQNDWYPQMNMLELAIRKMLTLPCDVILIAHDNAVKDDITGRISRGPLFTGKLTKRIPIMFDEVYYAHCVNTSKGTSYWWQTRGDSTNEAKSRLAQLATNAGREVTMSIPQDFKAVMRSAGLDTNDLPPLR